MDSGVHAEVLVTPCASHMGHLSHERITVHVLQQLLMNN